MSPTVAAALRHLDAQREEITGFLRTLIATPSITIEMGERAIAAVVQERTHLLGLPDPRVLSTREEHPNLVYHVHGPEDGLTLILNGHLDTQPVGAGSNWSFDPFAGVQVGERMYGLGSSDMKGSVAAMVYAMAALAHTGVLQKGTLVLALVANEEDGGAYGADWLVRKCGLTGDACVVGEPSGVLRDWEAIYAAQRGQSAVWVKVLGQQMHSGVAHAFGARNAAVQMARVIEAMDRDLRITPANGPVDALAQSTIGVLVRCGEAWGINPGTAEFGIDVRTLPGMEREDVARGMDQALTRLRQTQPEIEVSWRFHDRPWDWVAPTLAAADSALVRAAEAATASILGASLPLGVYPATTDASAFSGQGGIPTIAALGPGRISLAHRADEYVMLPAVLDAAKIYALLAAEYLNGSV